MKPLQSCASLLGLLCVCLPPVNAQPQPVAARTLLVLPFENRSKAPGIEWISEAFPEVLGDRISSSTVYVLSREDRVDAFDRGGIPANLHPSRATMYRVAEQMDADFAVLGDYDFDGQRFTARAQLLDMKRRQLLPEVSESGALVKLIEVQAALAWDLLRILHPGLVESRDTLIAATPAIRLDAFENYVRGVMALQREEKLRRFREAIRLAPTYAQPIEELGKTYYLMRDYEAAMNWLARVPPGGPLSREAGFYLGLAAYYRGDFARAEQAFAALAQTFPLTEVDNNLGVAQARRGKKSAGEYFRKAAEADPGDPDYRFNLAISSYRAGDLAGASRNLRECLSLRPGDAEAKALLGAVTQEAAAKLQPAAAPAPQVPGERIKRNYNENAFRQLALDVQNAAEARLVAMDTRQHAAFHVARGNELLAKGFSDEAEKEFREALQLNGSAPGAHAGMAGVLQAADNYPAARAEAQAELTLQPSAEAHGILGLIAVHESDRQTAGAELQQALQLDPAARAARLLQQELAPATPARVNSVSRP